MIKNLAYLVFGVFVTGLLVLGLAWSCLQINVRNWSDNPWVRERQVALVLTVVGMGFVVYEINRILNPPAKHDPVVPPGEWESEAE